MSINYENSLKSYTKAGGHVAIIYKLLGVFIDISVYRRYLSSNIGISSICFALNQWQLYTYMYNNVTYLNIHYINNTCIYSLNFTIKKRISMVSQTKRSHFMNWTPSSLCHHSKMSVHYNWSHTHQIEHISKKTTKIN
jgi:hypothetical protein